MRSSVKNVKSTKEPEDAGKTPEKPNFIEEKSEKLHEKEECGTEESESVRRSSRKRVANKRFFDEVSAEKRPNLKPAGSSPTARRAKLNLEEEKEETVAPIEVEEPNAVLVEYGEKEVVNPDDDAVGVNVVLEQEVEEAGFVGTVDIQGYAQEQYDDEGRAVAVFEEGGEHFLEEEIVEEECLINQDEESWYDWSPREEEEEGSSRNLEPYSNPSRESVGPRTEIGALMAEKIRQTKLRQSRDKKIAIERAVAEFPENVKIFDTRCIMNFEETARVLLSRSVDDIPKRLISTSSPNHAPMAIREATFLVDTRQLRYVKDVMHDKHGSWGKIWRSNAYYAYNQEEHSVKRLDVRDLKNKYIPQVYDAKIIKRLCHHPGAGGKLTKHVYTAEDHKGRPWPLALVGYQWHEGVTPFEFDALYNDVTAEIYNSAEDDNFDELYEAGSLPVQQDFFGEGVKLFSSRGVTDFQRATEIITEENLDENRVSTAIPLGAPLKTDQATFVVDLMCLQDMNELNVDNHGYWGKGNIHRDYFYFDEDLVKRSDKEAVRRRDYDVAAMKCLYRHPNTGKKLLKHIYTAKDKGGTLFRYALISYQWLVRPFAFESSNEMSMFTPNEDGSYPASNVLRNLTRKLVPEEAEERLKELRGEYYESSTEMVEDREGLFPFSPTAIREFRDAVDIMVRMDPSLFPTSTEVPPEAPMDQQEISFVVDLKALETPEHIFADQHGSWGKCGGDSIYYKAVGDNLQELRGSVGRNFTVKITKARYRHPNSDYKLRKFIFTCRNPKGRLLRWALVSYKWDECLPFRFQAGPPVRNLGGPQYMFEKPKTPKKARVLKKGQNEPIPEKATIFEKIPETPEELEAFQKVEFHDPISEDTEIIDPEEEFPIGVVPFSARLINTMIEAAHILLRRDPPGPLCTIVPYNAPKRMKKVSYLIDLQTLDDPRDISVDLHGSWGHNPGPERAYYRYNAWGGVKRLDLGKGKEPKGGYDVKMTKLRYLHEQLDRKLRKFIFVAQNGDGDYLRWGLISYQWFCEPFDFVPAPHGNAKKNLRPFQPTKPSVRTRLKELSLVYSPEAAVHEYLTEKAASSPYAAAHDLPRSAKQAGDCGRFPRSIHRAAALICKFAESNIRQFPSMPNAFSVMDETLGKDTAKCYTVNRQGEGEYNCDCEEYAVCCICRHSLAVARTQKEAAEFVDSLSDRMNDEGVERLIEPSKDDVEGAEETEEEEEGWTEGPEDPEPPPDLEEEEDLDTLADVKIEIKPSTSGTSRPSWRRKTALEEVLDTEFKEIIISK